MTGGGPGIPGVAVGVDPGVKSGALAVVDLAAEGGPRVEAWWAYLELDRKAGGVVRARGYQNGVATEWTAASLPRLAALLAPLALRAADGRAPGVLVLEGLFQARRSGLLALAESAGVWSGALEPHVGRMLRPRGQAWRRAVLGLDGDVAADRAEEYAIRWARRHLTWEHPPDGLTRVEEGAVCEAACMACFTG